VEYLYYLLLILALLAGCLFALKIPGRNRLKGRPEELAERAYRRRQRDQNNASVRAAELAHRHAVLERELKQVPTPWGWPGSDLNAGSGQDQGAGESTGHRPLQRWVDRLVNEKKTVQDDAYNQRREASLRALLEDRYGRAIKPSETTYRKVKPPLLRDPSLPYDQMDNFPSGKTDTIVSGLDKQPARPETERDAPLRKTGSLKEVKTPWGW
jgi:hypothetical protein